MHTKPRKSIFKIPFFVFAILLIVACSVKYMSGFITVSSTVNGRELPIYSVETDEKKVALSFDAAWGNEDTQRILDTLAAHNTHVTFFMTGGWVSEYPDDVQKIQEAGHDQSVRTCCWRLVGLRELR